MVELIMIIIVIIMIIVIIFLGREKKLTTTKERFLSRVFQNYIQHLQELPVLLHCHFSIWSSIWGGVINSICIGRKVIDSIGWEVFHPVRAVLWLGCVGGTRSSLGKKLDQKKEGKWEKREKLTRTLTSLIKKIWSEKKAKKKENWKEPSPPWAKRKKRENWEELSSQIQKRQQGGKRRGVVSNQESADRWKRQVLTSSSS